MPQHRHRTLSSGFTLLEMLVVLLIISLTGAIVLPRLPAMAASLEFALNRQTFEQEIGGLSYRAFRDNQDLVLSGLYTELGHKAEESANRLTGDTLPANLRMRSLTNPAREMLPPINPAVAKVFMPEGWRLEIKEPIYYRGSGYCTGGKVELAVGRQRYTYELSPPLCQVVLVP